MVAEAPDRAVGRAVALVVLAAEVVVAAVAEVLEALAGAEILAAAAPA